MANSNHRNALQPGYKVHWYRIEKILGQGGFGITYLAQDTNLNQPVAVKEYLPLEVAVRDGDSSVHPVSENHSDSFAWGLERFVDEARTLAQFDHPNIVRVLSVFEMNNTAYMVMRYECGRSLQQMLRKRATLEDARLREMLFPLLDGLERVHAAGFIHRDVKPANIFIREDESPVLLDFGSARQSLGQATRTLTTLVSPGYAPFEQYFSKSDRQGPWTDIYGLGATFYRVVTGVAPMNAVDRSEGILNHDRDPLIPATEAATGSYSPHLLEAIDWAVRFREETRPQNIRQWRGALEGETEAPAAAVTAGQAPAAFAGATTAAASSGVDLVLEPTTRTQPEKTQVLPERKPGRRRRYWVGAAAAGMILLVLLNAEDNNATVESASGNAWDTPVAMPAAETKTAALENANPPQSELVASANPAPEPTAELSSGNGNAAPSPQSDDSQEVAAVPSPPAPALSREARIAQLLEDAKADIDQLRLSNPPGNNALENYRQVLALDPNNAEAKTGVRNIVQTYAELGKQAAQRKDYERASFFIDQALAIAPKSRQLKKAQRRLNRLRRRNR